MELKGGSAQVASADAGQTVQPPKQSDAAAQTTVAKPAGASFIAQSQVVYAKDGGQVRAEPSAKAQMLSKLPTNAEVTASGISTDGKWWRVQLADGQIGYMHNSVVSEQPVQTASAAPVQSQPAQPQTLGADAFVPVAAAEQQQSVPQGNDVAQQLLSQAASQFGIAIPQGQPMPQPQPQQTASSLSFNDISKTINVRPGAMIFDAAGGQPIWQATQGGPMLATAQSSDGRWYKVSLWNSGEGYLPLQSVVK